MLHCQRTSSSVASLREEPIPHSQLDPVVHTRGKYWRVAPLRSTSPQGVSIVAGGSQRDESAQDVVMRREKMCDRPRLSAITYDSSMCGEGATTRASHGKPSTA